MENSDRHQRVIPTPEHVRVFNEALNRLRAGISLHRVVKDLRAAYRAIPTKAV